MTNPETFNLQNEYAELYQQGQRSLRENGVTVDPQLFPIEHDDRRGLGLFFWQSKLIPSTQVFLDTLHREFPDEILLYGYPTSPARQHVTLLELVNAHSNYANDHQALEEKFKDVVAPILATAPPIKATFQGLVVNSSGLLIKGYPTDNAFNTLRESLRTAIAAAGLPPLKRRKVQIFHTSVGRFIQPIQDIDRLIRVVDQFKEFPIGEDVYAHLYLLRASWSMADAHTHTIADFSLQ